MLSGHIDKKKGVITCPGIFPTAFAILWRRQSKAAAIIAPILGMATGFAVWLGSAFAFSGEITVASTGQILPCVYGTVASALSPVPYSLIITLFKPQNFSWDDFRKEKLAFDKLDEPLDTLNNQGELETGASQAQQLKRWGRIAVFWSLATFLGHWVLWPLPMYAAHYVFNRSVSHNLMLPQIEFHFRRRNKLIHLPRGKSSILPGWWWRSSGFG